MSACNSSQQRFFTLQPLVRGEGLHRNPPLKARTLQLQAPAQSRSNSPVLDLCGASALEVLHVAIRTLQDTKLGARCPNSHGACRTRLYHSRSGDPTHVLVTERKHLKAPAPRTISSKAFPSWALIRTPTHTNITPRALHKTGAHRTDPTRIKRDP